MKTIQALPGSSYPIINTPDNINRYANTFHHLSMTQVRTGAQVIGYGNSGAIMLGALIGSRHNPLLKYIHIPKNIDHSKKQPVVINDHIIIVDDHICTGKTIKKVHQYLIDNNVPLKYVVGVFAESWVESSGKNYFDKHKEMLVGLFPNINFWIH